MKKYFIAIVFIAPTLMMAFPTMQANAGGYDVIISNQLTCKGQGGTWSNPDQCLFDNLMIPTGESWLVNSLSTISGTLTVDGDLSAPTGLFVTDLINKGTISTFQLYNTGGSWLNDCDGTINLLENGALAFGREDTNSGTINGHSTNSIGSFFGDSTLVNNGFIDSDILLTIPTKEQISSPCQVEQTESTEAEERLVETESTNEDVLSQDEINKNTVPATKYTINQRHEPPTIGLASDGINQLVKNGICIDSKCWTVTKPYHIDFELVEIHSGVHTINTTIYCKKGVDTCNHVGLSVEPYQTDKNSAVWNIDIHKNSWSNNWELEVIDPADYLGEISFVTSKIDNNKLRGSFTIDFKKPTLGMQLGVHLWDTYYGSRNFYFNDGVEIVDKYAYPSEVKNYEEPILVNQFSLYQDPDNRDTYAFTFKLLAQTSRSENTFEEITRYNPVLNKFDESFISSFKKKEFNKTWNELKQCYEEGNTDNRLTCSFADKILAEILRAEEKFSKISHYKNLKHNFKD